MAQRRSDRGYPHGNPYRRTSANSIPPISSSRRSWTDNGVYYTVETTSSSGPGISFGTMSGSASGSFQGISHPTMRGQAPAFHVANSLLGGAFNLLDGFMSPGPSTVRQSMGQIYDEDVSSEKDDGDEVYATRRDTTERPRSILSRFKDRLWETKQDHRQPSYSRDPSPARRPPPNTRQGGYQTELREPSWAEPMRGPFTHDDVDDFQQRCRPGTRRVPSTTADTIEALECAVEHHSKEVCRCKKQLEQASRSSRIGADDLQALLDMLKWQEAARDNALHDLQSAQGNQGRPRSERRATPPLQPTPTSSRRGSARTVHEDMRDQFFGTPMGFLPQQRTASHPLFAEVDEMFPAHVFGTFGHVFQGFGLPSPLHDDFDHFFGMPGAVPTNAQRKRPRVSTAHGGPHFHQPPSHSTSPPQTPPSTVLTPIEAKKLYQLYSDRWTALSPSDPNIPFPARNLRGQSLLARDSLWAPRVSAHPSTWSDEAVMQANTQAFFLGVVNLSPQYTEAPGTGRIQMGFDKVRASSTQVQQLVDLLKKEKVRWHSDRLGRRNGGNPGPNEALQQNEQARAVFHAVCELVEVAQGAAGIR